MKNIFIVLIFFLALISQMLFGQVLTKKDFKNIVSNKKTEISFFVGKHFKLKYSGPRKQGGLISHFENKQEDELLFLYDDDDGNFQQLNYYLPTKEKYLKLFSSLKSIDINSTKSGKTFENGKLYYQLIVSKNEK